MKMDINFLTIVDPKREMFFKNYKEILLYRNIK